MESLPPLDEFLQDISAKNPVGESMKYSNAYDQIREAMRSEDPNLPLGIWMTDIKKADWQKTAGLCTTLLQKDSKDLRVAAWLIEAWIHLFNIDGLVTGLSLFSQLAEKYWADAYPQITDGDFDFRVSPYIWMNDKLADRIQFIRVTEPKMVGDQAYTFSDWIEVSRLKDLYPVGDRHTSDTIEQVGSSKTPTLLDFDTNMVKTSSDFLRHIYTQVIEAESLCKDIEKFVKTKIPDNPPSLYQMRKVLNDILKFIIQTLHDRGINVNESMVTDPNDNFANPAGEGVESPPETPMKYVTVKGVPMPDTTPTSPENASINPASPATSATAGGGSINEILQSRDAAYQRINEAADYLSKIEPHSPVPYLIKRAVSWRNKSFMDLMKEMVNDPAGVTDINKLLGFPGSGGGGSTQGGSPTSDQS